MYIVVDDAIRCLSTLVDGRSYEYDQVRSRASHVESKTVYHTQDSARGQEKESYPMCVLFGRMQSLTEFQHQSKGRAHRGSKDLKKMTRQCFAHQPLVRESTHHRKGWRTLYIRSLTHWSD